MSEDSPSTAEVEAQLEKMLSSPLFRSRGKEAAFLKTAVNFALNKQPATQYDMAYALLNSAPRGKGEKVPTAEDETAVRVRMVGLRKTLAEYYREDGCEDPIEIGFAPPNGRKGMIKSEWGTAYTPFFRRKDQISETIEFQNISRLLNSDLYIRHVDALVLLDRYSTQHGDPPFLLIALGMAFIRVSEYVNFDPYAGEFLSPDFENKTLQCFTYAQQCFEKVVKTQEYSAQAAFYLSVIAQKLGKLDEAAEWLKRARAPLNVDGVYGQKHAPEASADLREIIEFLDPDGVREGYNSLHKNGAPDVEELILMAYRLTETEQYDSAFSVIREAMTFDQNRAVLNLLRFKCLYKTGHLALAKELLEKRLTVLLDEIMLAAIRHRFPIPD